jgi:hypothetical protein
LIGKNIFHCRMADKLGTQSQGIPPGSRANRKLTRYRNFFFGFENRAIAHTSRFVAIPQSAFHREQYRRSAIH